MNSALVPVFSITPLASELIWQLVDACDFPDSAGVRIAPGAPTEPDVALELELVDRPQPGDEVVRADGARVYLDPAIAQHVADTVLDAGLAGEGRVKFALRDRRRRASRNGNGRA